MCWCHPGVNVDPAAAAAAAAKLQDRMKMFAVKCIHVGRSLEFLKYLETFTVEHLKETGA